jgi:hypothetical protein
MIFAAPVTRCIPTEPLFETPGSIFLQGASRARIENWLESGEIPLLSAETTQLSPVRDDDAYSLSVTNAASGIATALHFSEHTPDLDISHHQGDFDRDQFVPDWTVRLPPDWFANLRKAWLGKWFAGLGKFNHIMRRHNAMLTLKVASNGLTIVYNQEDTNDPASAAPITFQFPNPIKAKCPCESSFASKDIGPVLFNLADVPVIGDIIVSGNRHAIVFGYQTQSGRYEVAIPTLLPSWRERDQSKAPDRDDYLFGPVDSIFPVENCVCQ